MINNDKLRIKRSYTQTTVPELEFGEIAFTDVNNSLYIGKADGSVLKLNSTFDEQTIQDIIDSIPADTPDQTIIVQTVPLTGSLFLTHDMSSYLHLAPTINSDFIIPDYNPDFENRFFKIKTISPHFTVSIIYNSDILFTLDHIIQSFLLYNTNSEWYIEA